MSKRDRNTEKVSALSRLVDDFRVTKGVDPGFWPTAPKVAVYVVIAALVVALIGWLVWRDQNQRLEDLQRTEMQLRDTWKEKKQLAVNLDTYKSQLAEVRWQVEQLLKQLPKKDEMARLLSEVNQAGVGRGLQFDLWKPGSEVSKEYYAELPIQIQIRNGSYGDLGMFVGDVAKMSRIVTINDIVLETKDGAPLTLDGKAVTYRYLDPDAAQRVE